MSRRVVTVGCLNCRRPIPLDSNPHEQEQFCTPWCEGKYEQKMAMREPGAIEYPETVADDFRSAA